MNGSLLAMVLVAGWWQPDASADTVPGGVVELYLAASAAGPPSVFYGSHPVLVRRADNGWQALVAIDLDTAPGDYVLRIERADEDPVHHTITVRPRPQPPRTRPAAPPSSAADRAGYPPPAPATPDHDWRPQLDASLPLSYPVYRSVLLDSDRRYGSRRLAADGSYAWDLGFAFRVRNNSRVVSPGGGMVSEVVSAGPRAFAVYVDHGMGLISGVYPVTEVEVAPGDRLSRGAMLGRLYDPDEEAPVVVTWTLRLNGTHVDPAFFASMVSAATEESAESGTEEAAVTTDQPSPPPAGPRGRGR